jgi:uncharacterized OB-fold protein
MTVRAADPEFAPFWEAVDQARLVVQECAQCGLRRWPPRPVCSRCHSTGTRWAEIRGTGTLYSWVVVHRAGLSARRDAVPFTVAVVALDDDPAIRFLGGLSGAADAELAIGQPVEVSFEPDGVGTLRPYWHLRP